MRQSMSDIWFTSDLHFGHDNIVKYCDRPCTVAEHSDFIIESLNTSKMAIPSIT